jgi:phosphatidylglycerophosphate synthase
VRRAVVLGGSVARSRLVEQLRALRIEDVEVLDVRGVAEGLDAVASLARSSPDGLVVLGGDVFTHREALAGLLADPRIGTGVLVTEEEVPGEWPVRATRGRVESAGSPWHSVSASTGTFLGVLKVVPGDAGALAEVAGRLASLPGLESSGSPARDVPALLAVGLVRSGVHVQQSYRRELYWARADSPESLAVAQREIASYDEDRVLLESAVKPIDGFFTTFFVSPYSKYIARWAARRGLTPNVVTTVSMGVGVVAAAFFALGSRAGLVVGAVLLQAAFTLDCVDGQLARYTRTFSKFGAWLDSVFDRGKEYVVYAGLALGGSRAGDPVWLLAGAALTLQTVRHTFDFAWGATQQHAMGTAWQPPLEARSDRRPPAGGPGSGAGPAEAAVVAPPDEPPSPESAAGSPSPSPAGTTLTEPQRPEPAAGSRPPAASAARRLLTGWLRLNRWPGMIWVKRVLAFPIGERFAAISITAALFTPRTTFVVLLACGTFAALYGLAGRLLRSAR